MGRVFLITGTSTGFGQHLVQEVLDKGDIAVGKFTSHFPEYTRQTRNSNTLSQQPPATLPPSPLKTPLPRIFSQLNWM